jgi:hypothetical protein
MAESIVTLSADDTALLKSVQRQQAGQEKIDQGYKSNERSSKKAADQAIEDAKRVEREGKNAANALFREHKKMLDDLEREKRQAMLDGESLARQIALQETKVLLAQADAQIAALDKVAAAKAKAHEDSEKARNQVNGLVSDSLRGFAEMATGVGLVTAATMKLTEAFALVKKAKDDALQNQQGLSESNRRLVQVSNSPEDLANMQKRADDAAMATGVSRDVARQVLFSARSEGFESSFEGILASNEVLDPMAASTVAGKVPALFGGKIGSMEAVSLGLRAAKDSNLNFEQMATSLPTAAEGGALVGASPEELFAVQGVLASRFKSGDTAADRIKSFSSSAGIDERMSGKGIIGAFDTISAMSDEERTEYLGKNQELNAVFKILGEEMPKIKKQLSVLEKERADFAAGGGALREQIQIASADAGIQNVSNVRKAQVTEEVIKSEKLATKGGDDAVATAQANALIEQKDANMVDRLVTTSVSSGLQYVGGISPDSKADISSAAGDTASNPLNVAAGMSNPTGALGTFAANLVFSRSRTLIARNQIDSRLNNTNNAIDQSFAGGPQPGLQEVVKATQDTARAVTEANKLMEENNRLLQASKPQDTGSGNAQAIRNQIDNAKQN